MPHTETIRLRGARTHNLRDLDLEIPRRAFTVITGVSGSGKSSLAFDTLFQEGQRRFLEALPSFARQYAGRLARPDLQSIEGLGPAIALGQRAPAPNPRSTVGTLTEAWDLLRLLYARLGTAPEGIRPTRGLFSFNGEEGACPQCRGLGVEDRLDPELLVADPARTIREGALRVSTPNGYLMYSQVTLPVLDEVLKAHGGSVDIPWRELDEELRRVVLHGSDRLKVPYGKHPLESRLKWTGITARPRPEGFYRGLLPVMEEILRGKRNDSILRFVQSRPCGACAGTRLRAEARAVTWRERGIAELAALSARELNRALEVEASSPREAAVFEPIRRELRARLELMAELGLDYLSLDRAAPTLSRGELQRLRLMPLALGDLSGLLVVLDEPSAGLHPAEAERLVKVLRRLRDQGQTVVAVEHEARLALSADWLVDLGPGPGPRGGALLWSGPPAELLARKDPPDTPTRRWLAGEGDAGSPHPGRGLLRLEGLSRHTVRDQALDLERGALNVLVGLSGSGKTSLLEAVAGRLADRPDPFDRVLQVDAEPLGRSPRSNAATYSGAFDLIRDRYAALPEAKRRGLGKTHFSFNTAGGRCEACEGAGVLEVGMRHLGRVEVPCGSCGGRRFHPEVLEVSLDGLNIAELLELDLARVAERFRGRDRLARILEALVDAGLGHLPLGQPATTLSGGEAQRVKLATELARAGKGAALILLDEPTAGLHEADVATLLAAWDRLLEAGHTLLVADNRASVIRRAGRIHELGPGSGPEGGRLCFSGSLPELLLRPESPSAACLRVPPRLEPGAPPALAAPPLILRGATTHNLRNLHLDLPAVGLCAITGPSGSGKSSLLFDTLVAEAQNRFADLVSPWARRLLSLPGEARFESATGLQLSLSVPQAPGRRNPRATVGTATELDALLRLLYARCGERPCPACGSPARGGRCAQGHRLPELWAADFSPREERGACPDCRGLGFHPRCEGERLIGHPERPLAGGALEGTRFGAYLGEPEGRFMATLRAAARAENLDLDRPWRELEPRARELALRGSGETIHEVAWAYRRGGRSGIHTLHTPWEGLARLVEAEYERVHGGPAGEELEALMADEPCPACAGERLRPEARAFRFGGRRLPERMSCALARNLAEFRELPEAEFPGGLRGELLRRLEALTEAGLGHLALDRELSSLSGGEAQRVRLAGSLTGGLVGVTYALDEPTRGLHARDIQRLVGVLRRLAEAGNAVLVVEQDPQVLAAADHLLELGPGAGPEGGRLVFQGPPSGWKPRPGLPPQPLPPALREGLRLRGARLRNLKNLDLELPLGGVVALSGVSGSGKSTLLHGVLGPSLRRHQQGLGPIGCTDFASAEHFQEVRALGQDPSAASSASSVLTRLGLADPLRRRLAATPEAKAARLQAKHFSAASPGGRCEACQGSGRITVALDLLPDVVLSCESCGGQGFKPEVLACRLAGRSLPELLERPLRELPELFPGLRPFAPTGSLLQELGLGHLRLGQGLDTLSDGERQRLELARLLAEPPEGPCALLLDEPSRGLGRAELPALLELLRRLAKGGHLVVMVEHQLDLIAASDWVIDLGPDGGEAGGHLMAQGPPSVIAECPDSATGVALRATGR